MQQRIIHHEVFKTYISHIIDFKEKAGFVIRNLLFIKRGMRIC